MKGTVTLAENFWVTRSLLSLITVSLVNCMQYCTSLYSTFSFTN